MGRTFVDDEKVTKAALACARMCRDTNAGILKYIGYDLDEKPIFALILVDGTESTQGVIEAIENAEAKWESETETETFPDSALRRLWNQLRPHRN